MSSNWSSDVKFNFNFKSREFFGSLALALQCCLVLAIMSIKLSLEWQEDSQLMIIIPRLNPKLKRTMRTRMTLVASQADAKRFQTGSRLGVVQQLYLHCREKDQVQYLQYSAIL